MTRYLLDVNVLIALIDPAHVQHERAHAWFEATGSRAWATCPLTENGVVRIVGHARYPSCPGTPAAVAGLMTRLCAHPGHAFWPDTLSLLDDRVIRQTRLLDSGQITDSYLLALARAHEGRLATLDRRLVIDAVVGGLECLETIG